MQRTESLSQTVLACAFEVSSRLGVGFVESVYENALCIELQQMGMHFYTAKAFESDL